MYKLSQTLSHYIFSQWQWQKEKKENPFFYYSCSTINSEYAKKQWTNQWWENYKWAELKYNFSCTTLLICSDYSYFKQWSYKALWTGFTICLILVSLFCFSVIWGCFYPVYRKICHMCGCCCSASVALKIECGFTK